MKLRRNLTLVGLVALLGFAQSCSDEQKNTPKKPSASPSGPKVSGRGNAQAQSQKTPPGVSLQGSAASVARMAKQAELHDFSRMSTGKKIMNFVRGGLLVRLKGNGDYTVDKSVSYPYVRREVRTFTERWSAQSRTPDAKGIVPCPAGLVVTSGSRPTNRQPQNASKRSVHPNGMAVDFRIPEESRCMLWVETTLLQLEGAKVLEATRERTPPHYHVAVFPNPYKEYTTGKKAEAKTPPLKRKR